MTGKRFAGALAALLMALTLTACGGKEPEPVPTEPMPTEPAVEVIAPTEAPTEPEPEPEVIVNPLTGEECSEELSLQRPIAVMLNNHKKAQPQAGCAAADVIYEIPAEGGITRMMALYQSVEGVGEIGTVRSAREYYTSLALGHDAIYLHAGGSDGAYIFIKNNKMTAMDCVNGPYEGSLFWRDKARWNKSGMEHSVMTSGETILELFPTYENLRTQREEGHEVKWSFTTEAPSAQNEAAVKLTVPFSSYKTGVFVYDPETGLYMAEQYGKAYTDGDTGEQVGVNNVLVLYTEADVIKGDTAGRLDVRTTGEGEGILLRGGTVEPITWKRADERSTLEFYRADGSEAQLSVGKTYINILDAEDQAYWE